MRKRMRKSRGMSDNPGAGFTLIEVTISVAILALISIPLINYFTDSMGYSVMTVNRQRATFLAQEITEGLLSDNRLVVPDESGGSYKYKIPFLTDGDYDVKATASSELLSSGKGSASFIRKTTDDGYLVDVEIKAEEPLEDVQSLSDYEIDPLTDVVYIDSTENTQAVFELMGAHNTYCSSEAGASATVVNKADVEPFLSRVINIKLTKDSGSGTYQVQITYEYQAMNGSNSVVRSVDGSTGGAWKKTVLDKTVGDLQNIYLFYNWCEKGDTVSLTFEGISGTPSNPFNLGLYLICQPDEDAVGTPNILADKGYILTLKPVITATSVNLLGYTNLKNDRLDTYAQTVFYPPSPGSPGTAEGVKPALVYTIRTSVYPEGDEERKNLLAEITATKGE